jgi:predicted dehydrogenase
VNVAVVGCGLIGARRAATAASAGDVVVAVADLDESRAEAVAAKVGAEVHTQWSDVVSRADVDVVVVATINRDLAPIAVAALEAGKHVLCEKPLGRNAQEAESIVAAAERAARTLKTGFNHRHHPALFRAQGLVSDGAIGDPFALRVAYGHGGRPGYDKEWRGSPELAGGGELLDQGVHVVDLARWFLGEVDEVSGALGTWVWDVKPLEDNAFALLRFQGGAIASLHTSWTQWRNLFRFELFGDSGHLVVEGLGGSYGVETLTVGRRFRDGGAPEEHEERFDVPDMSWAEEWEEFRRAIETATPPLGSGTDGLAAARVIDAIYRSAREGRAVKA